MTRHSRRHVLGMGAASAGALILPRFAIAQGDNRPSITIAVQKVVNSNVLDVLREQSNVGERVFFSSLWEGLIAKNWRGSLEAVPGLATEWRRIDDQSVELKLRRGVKFLFETNVGAGLPVINTMNDLLLSGDKVVTIEAVLSGTLNYIFSAFTPGRKFSEVVGEAKAKGYTEPDPRDDLSGMDVARKMLILSREAGYDLELSDITVQNLVPDDCRGVMTIDQFFAALEKHDGEFDKLRSATEERNEKLRYKAILHEGRVSVELGSVADQHPFYSLSGSDNIILLTTERYHERPMVIRGPGAGATVTAAGVFADIIRIGNYAQ